MSLSKIRLTALAGCAVGVLAMAGCGVREPVETPPASIAPGYEGPEAPEPMGPPPAAEAAPADGLLGGPDVSNQAATSPAAANEDPRLKTWRRPDGTLVTAMAPIANPEAAPRVRAEVRHRAVRDAPRAEAAPAHRLYAATPAPNPAVKPAARASAPPAARPVAPLVAPVLAKPAPKPATVAAAPAPLKPVVAAKPAAPLARAPTPVFAAPTASKSAPAKPLTRLQQLQAAVAPEATKGAVLASAASLAQGQEGQVTLALPATLGDLIKKEARKLGLAKAARRINAYADLRGEGYEITPSGRQTAVVQAGQPATFAWTVKPTPEAKGPLKAEFGAELNGVAPAQGFSLGSIARQVAPVQDTIKDAAKGMKLALPDLGGLETIDVPGLGKVPGKSVLGGVLILLALLILVVIARGASAAEARARARRRREIPNLTAYDPNGAELRAPRTVVGGPVGGAAAPSAAGQNPAPTEHDPFATPIQRHEGPAPGDPFAPTPAGARTGPKELEPTP